MDQQIQNEFVARALAGLSVIRRIVKSIPGYIDSMDFDLNVIESKELFVFIDMIKTLLEDLPTMKISDIERRELELALYDVAVGIRLLTTKQTIDLFILEAIGAIKAKGKSSDN